MSWFPSILAFAFLYHALDYSCIFWHKHLPAHLRILPLIFIVPWSTQNPGTKGHMEVLVPTVAEFLWELFKANVVLFRSPSLVPGQSHGHAQYPLVSLLPTAEVCADHHGFEKGLLLPQWCRLQLCSQKVLVVWLCWGAWTPQWFNYAVHLPASSFLVAEMEQQVVLFW